MLRYLLFTALLLVPMSASAQEKVAATLYKNPACGCCESYAAYLRSNGFDVTIVEDHNMTMVKRQHGVRKDLESCHTMLIDGYVVEGHVPVTAVKRLLSEKPAIKGIALPGMPAGSPGMSGVKQAPFTIFAITDDEPAKVYARE